MRLAIALCLVLALPAGASELEQARKRWADSPHGPMLERLLPPTFAPEQLPAPKSRGARLTLKYCVQCHNLANPAMHHAAKWPGIVDRMVLRMQGRGNMGELMKEMMAQVEAPSDRDVQALKAYFRKYAQKEIDPAHPALRGEAGQIYTLACSQCHATPDPAQHTAREWPRVVERMKHNMKWANVVVGPPELRTTPELRTEEIVKLLQRYARPEVRKK